MFGCVSHNTWSFMFRPAPSSGKTTDQNDSFSDAIGQLENNIPGDETKNFPGDHQTNNIADHDDKANYRFSIGQLPSWAKKQVHAKWLCKVKKSKKTEITGSGWVSNFLKSSQNSPILVLIFWVVYHVFCVSNYTLLFIMVHVLSMMCFQKKMG